MTYFELIKYLNELKGKPITADIIEYLNNIDMHFTSQKYIRFLNHMEDFFQYRLEKIYSLFLDKTSNAYLDKDALTIEIDVVKREIQMLLSLCKLSIISEASQNEFKSSIIESNNDLVNYISNVFNDDERKNIFLSLLFKEES